jgi:ubiquinone biosynthesis protein UbiJ
VTQRSRVVHPSTAKTRSTTPRRAIRLTEEERQILLEELAEIAAELDSLQQRAAEMTARVSDPSSTRLSGCCRTDTGYAEWRTIKNM